MIRSKACSSRERDPFLPSVPVLRREGNAALELALDDRDVDDATDIDSVEATARDLTHHAERSEEHTSELQSLMRISYAVFCLKKKNKTNNETNKKQHHTTSPT